MKKILVLDDNTDILEVVNEVLSYEGFIVETLNSSRNFLDKATQFLPDVILLDFLLPNANGGELCRQVKAHEKLKDIPVIIFSAYLLKEADVKLLGCDLLLMKPFYIDDLLLAINTVLAESV